MTTYFPFVPSNQAPFQFQPTLDGDVYSVVVTWNIFGKRYYVNCNLLDGTQVFTIPNIESTTGVNLESLEYDINRNTVVATTSDPHGYPVGSTIELTVDGCSPDGYNGTYRCLITGSTAFSYSLPMFPGNATAFGVVSYNINMAAGYFNSTLVFRSGQFEVNP